MKSKTSELIGNPLAWAVAVANGNEPFFWANWDGEEFPETDDGPYRPDLEWSQGGPIIEREGVSTVSQGDAHEWVASLWDYSLQDWTGHISGPTPLVAAMRCYCCAKLGEFVDIPEELCQQESN